MKCLECKGGFVVIDLFTREPCRACGGTSDIPDEESLPEFEGGDLEGVDLDPEAKTDVPRHDVSFTHEELLAEKFAARASGLRDAERAVLEEVGIQTARLRKAVAGADAAAAGEAKAMRAAAWSIYARLQAVRKWTVSAGTYEVGCRHAFEPYGKDVPGGEDGDVKACTLCGIVEK